MQYFHQDSRINTSVSDLSMAGSGICYTGSKPSHLGATIHVQEKHAHVPTRKRYLVGRSLNTMRLAEKHRGVSRLEQATPTRSVATQFTPSLGTVVTQRSMFCSTSINIHGHEYNSPPPPPPPTHNTPCKWCQKRPKRRTPGPATAPAD